jgi:hypothetical protein
VDKKSWGTPELIVLMRSKPEEMVLTHCKFEAAAPNPDWPGGYVHGCGEPEDAGGSVGCGTNCQSRGASGT